MITTKTRMLLETWPWTITKTELRDFSTVYMSTDCRHSSLRKARQCMAPMVPGRSCVAQISLQIIT
ncbi:hypothetical protein BaRGS_00039303, partial [Batillaria attramentaria]